MPNIFKAIISIILHKSTVAEKPITTFEMATESIEPFSIESLIDPENSSIADEVGEIREEKLNKLRNRSLSKLRNSSLDNSDNGPKK